jgi:hypothetical protein
MTKLNSKGQVVSFQRGEYYTFADLRRLIPCSHVYIIDARKRGDIPEPERRTTRNEALYTPRQMELIVRSVRAVFNRVIARENLRAYIDKRWY